jgi:hypothetical protein
VAIVDVGPVRPRLPRKRLGPFHVGSKSPVLLSTAPSATSPGGIPVGDPQGPDVTVVDLVQLGVLALLLGPDFNDMSSGGGSDLLPLGIGTGACNGPLLVPGRIPAVWAGE